MLPSIQFPARTGRYSLLPDASHDEKNEDLSPTILAVPKRSRYRFILSTGVILLCLACGFMGGTLFQRHTHPLTSQHFSTQHSLPCKEPVIRREWRTLSKSEKRKYIAAVQCLRSKPSTLDPNQTLYDDFPWVHTQLRGHIHDTAAFLAWHRYFIHIFETALKKKCDYSGHLAYWNWVLDWEDITKSPIWDRESGFGGNGAGGPSVGNGSCVTDGPFAYLTALSYGIEEKSHCLSRGFLGGAELEQTSARRLKPEAIEEVLSATNYELFNLGLEHGPHNGIPYGVRGDFLKFTAPYDPVFFLHHTQLDRLWWIWQQINIPERLQSYSGLARGSSMNASLDDILDVHGLAPNVRVSDIMNTETELLCYRYPSY